MERSSTGACREMSIGLRWLLRIATVLVLVAGVQLFVLAEKTDRYFAWTIRPPMTAAFVGAAYWSALGLTIYGSLKRNWAETRTIFPSVLTFSVLSLVTTILHWDRFHFNSDDGNAAFAAWAWFIVYVVVPAVGVRLWLMQLRIRGSDPPKRLPLPNWLRVALVAQGAVLLLTGLALFVDPSGSAPHLWPWALSPLTARAVSTWLLAIGVEALHAAWENEWRNIEPPAITYFAFSILQLVALARFGFDDAPDSGQPIIDWASPKSWAYLAFLVSIVVVGAYVAAEMLRRRRRQEGTARTSR